MVCTLQNQEIPKKESIILCFSSTKYERPFHCCKKILKIMITSSLGLSLGTVLLKYVNSKMIRKYC